MECTLLFTQCNCLVSVQVQNMNTRKLLLRAVESKTKCKCSTHEFSSTWVLKVQILMDSQLGKIHNLRKLPRKRSYWKIITKACKLNKYTEHILSPGKFLTLISQSYCPLYDQRNKSVWEIIIQSEQVKNWLGTTFAIQVLTVPFCGVSRAAGVDILFLES